MSTDTVNHGYCACCGNYTVDSDGYCHYIDCEEPEDLEVDNEWQENSFRFDHNYLSSLQRDREKSGFGM